MDESTPVPNTMGAIMALYGEAGIPIDEHTCNPITMEDTTTHMMQSDVYMDWNHIRVMEYTAMHKVK